jgi:hypothetical protein
MSVPRGPCPLHVLKDCWVQGVVDENTLVWGQVRGSRSLFGRGGRKSMCLQQGLCRYLVHYDGRWHVLHGELWVRGCGAHTVNAPVERMRRMLGHMLNLRAHN